MEVKSGSVCQFVNWLSRPSRFVSNMLCPAIEKAYRLDGDDSQLF